MVAWSYGDDKLWWRHGHTEMISCDGSYGDDKLW